MFSEAYVQLLRRGPFPGCIDPWAEDDYYFHQLHNTILSSLIHQMARPLLENDYILSLELSLQIAGEEKSDDWDHTDLNAIYIRYRNNPSALTIIELVSPYTKSHPEKTARYQVYRQRMIQEVKTNVVEIDLTRSTSRLVAAPFSNTDPYYVAIFIPDEPLRLIKHEFAAPLRRFALPLYKMVLSVDLQSAYDEAYQCLIIAPQIQQDRKYNVQHFPQNSIHTIDDEQRQAALQTVEAWQNQLNTLKPGA
jgi:hypothetical protein